VRTRSAGATSNRFNPARDAHTLKISEKSLYDRLDSEGVSEVGGAAPKKPDRDQEYTLRFEELPVAGATGLSADGAEAKAPPAHALAAKYPDLAFSMGEREGRSWRSATRS
jgi:hypothetical protein